MRTSDSSSSASSATVDRQTADQLGNQPVAEQIVRLDFGERILRLVELLVARGGVR